MNILKWKFSTRDRFRKEKRESTTWKIYFQKSQNWRERSEKHSPRNEKQLNQVKEWLLRAKEKKPSSKHQDFARKKHSRKKIMTHLPPLVHVWNFDFSATKPSWMGGISTWSLTSWQTKIWEPNTFINTLIFFSNILRWQLQRISFCLWGVWSSTHQRESKRRSELRHCFKNLKTLRCMKFLISNFERGNFSILFGITINTKLSLQSLTSGSKLWPISSNDHYAKGFPIVWWFISRDVHGNPVEVAENDVILVAQRPADDVAL